MKRYKRGLILGKFMPITKGHESLIDYGLSICDEIVVLVCTTPSEPISGDVRYKFVCDIFRGKSIIPIHLVFDERELSSTSVPARDISKKWAEYIIEFVPEVDVFISSEKYGEMVSSVMGIDNVYFDIDRVKVDISATQIRQNPYMHWDMISEPVRDFFFKKIVIIGTESTGKTEMCKWLSKRFESDWVPEAGRELIQDTHDCSQRDLQKVAKEHAKNIIIAEQKRSKLLFIDTDINITKSYHRFLFKEDMKTSKWMDIANKGDLYIYLESDAPYVQDGTRLSKKDRDLLDESHKEQLALNGLHYYSVFGKDWNNRRDMALEIIHRHILMPYNKYNHGRN